MRPWLAVWRGGRRSIGGPCRSTSHPFTCRIESLEDRRLLSGATLAVGFVGPTPTLLAPGVSQRVKVRITNAGDAPAVGGANVRLYVSADPVLDASDTLVGAAGRRSTLKAHRGATLKVKMTAPASVAAGDDYLLAAVDSPSNTSGAPVAVVTAGSLVMIRPPFVDLTGRVAQTPHGAIEASGLKEGKVRVEVRNNGNVTSGGRVEVRLYASLDGKLDSSDTAIGVAPARPLKVQPGKTQTVFADVAVPVGTTPGLYYIFAQVDSANAVVESDESNNLALSGAPVQLIAPAPPPHDSHHHPHRDFIGLGSGYVDESEAGDCGCDVPVAGSGDFAPEGPADVPAPADEPAPHMPSSGPTSEPAPEPAPEPEPQNPLDTGGDSGSSDSGGGSSESFDSSGADF